MQSITVRLIFDKLLTMETGESMLIPCYSIPQRESLRVQLYREKKEWSAKGYGDYDITISKETTDEGIFLRIQKTKKIDAIIIQKKDGSSNVLPVTEEVPEEYQVETTEGEDRIRKLMKENGKSDKEIEEYFSSKTSNNDTS